MADLERFVSSKGIDKPGRGTSTEPFLTIQYAATDIFMHRSTGQNSKIFVEPGTYEELVVLSDGMQLMRSDSTDHVTVDVAKEFYTEKGPGVIIKRPKTASAPGKSSSAPTWTEIVKIAGKNISIRGIRIDGDQRPQRALYIHDSTDVTITGCLITGSYSRILYTGKGAGTEADPFHSSVQDEGEGAGLRIFKSQKVTLKNNVFVDNRTELKYIQELTDDELDKVKDTFGWKHGLSDDEQAAAEKRLRQAIPVRTGGGHVSCYESDQIHIENCHFEDGFAGGRGGALQFARDAYGDCVSCLFRGNEAGVDGGGVACSDPNPDPDARGKKPVSFTDCKFKNNRGNDDGGGLYMTTNTRASLRNCLFENNDSKSNGGALRATFGAVVSLVDCVFRGNRANIDAPVRLEKNQDGGGAIAVNNSILLMQGGKVENNSVMGFAGGGIYFITAAYNKNAERVADITHGHTFEKILKDGYGITSVTLTLSGVTFQNNTALDETCNEDTCTLSPRTGFSPRGAGGAIYVLESTEHFGVPVTVNLTNVQIIKNVSGHKDDGQRADLVIRNVTKVIAKATTIVPDPHNKFAASFIDVDDADLSASPDFANNKVKGLINDSKSTIQY